MIFGKHINRYYIRFLPLIILGLIALVVVENVLITVQQLVEWTAVLLAQEPAQAMAVLQLVLLVQTRVIILVKVPVKPIATMLVLPQR